MALKSGWKMVSAMFPLVVLTEAQHRMEQAVGAVDKLRRRTAFGAKRPSGRMIGIRLDCNQATVLDDRHAAAARSTKRAISGDLPRRVSFGHGRPSVHSLSESGRSCPKDTRRGRSPDIARF